MVADQHTVWSGIISRDIKLLQWWFEKQIKNELLQSYHDFFCWRSANTNNIIGIYIYYQIHVFDSMLFFLHKIRRQFYAAQQLNMNPYSMMVLYFQYFMCTNRYSTDKWHELRERREEEVKKNIERMPFVKKKSHRARAYILHSFVALLNFWNDDILILYFLSEWSIKEG